MRDRTPDHVPSAGRRKATKHVGARRGRFSFAALRGGVDFVASSATKDAPGLGELVAAMNKFAG